MTLRFRVEGIGAAIPIAFSAVKSAGSPEPERPTAASRTYDIRPASPHSVRMEYRLPRPVPAEMCFNVYAHFTGTGLRSALLIQNACWGKPPRSGRGQRIELKPDLAVSIDAAPAAVFHPMNLAITIRNIGAAPKGLTGLCWTLNVHLPRAEAEWPAGWNVLPGDACRSIPGGGSLGVSRRFVIPASADAIRVAVDPDRVWAEIREDNNTGERLVGVPPRIRGTEPVRPDIRKR